MEKRTGLSYFSFFVIFVAIAFVGVIIFWMIYPYKTLTVEQTTINPKTVKSGELVFTHTKFCIYTNEPIKVNTDLVGELVVVQLPPRDIQVTYPQGCDEVDSIRQLPVLKNVGVFHFESTATIRVNPIREETITWRSEDIEVVEASAEGDL